jgi:2-oxoglutarate dehydrogenase E2 component (dihydrolipoamide succinyltransferase)
MAVEIKMPQLGETVVEGTIGKWLKQVGDRVEKYEPLLEVITDKVDSEIPSPAEGVLLKILVPEGETVQAGTVIALLGEEGEEVAPAPPPGPAEVARTKPRRPPRISPVVARIAAEHDVDLSQVKGTGRGGRVTKKDILRFIEEREKVAPEAPPAPPKVPEAPAPIPGEVIELTPMRRAIAEHMVRSKRTAPHVTTVMEVDMSRVVAFREAHKEEFRQREGFNLTYTPFFVQAVVAGLKAVPIVNSTLTDEGIVIRKEINIGIAVAVDEGLIVPVIKHADEKSLLKLAREVNDLATRAREKRLSPDDVQGGTFTITNHGVGGSLFATPIINQPQAAILGVGAITKRVVVVNDAIAIRPMCFLSLTFDHRVLDGAVADRFLARVKEYLENFVGEL